MKEMIDVIGTHLMLFAGLGLMGFVVYIRHRENMAMLGRLECRRSPSHPIETAPRNRRILIKIDGFGWVETHWSDHDKDSDDRGILLWAELPEDNVTRRVDGNGAIN